MNELPRRPCDYTRRRGDGTAVAPAPWRQRDRRFSAGIRVAEEQRGHDISRPHHGWEPMKSRMSRRGFTTAAGLSLGAVAAGPALAEMDAARAEPEPSAEPSTAREFPKG